MVVVAFLSNSTNYLNRNDAHKNFLNNSAMKFILLTFLSGRSNGHLVVAWRRGR